MYIFNVLWELLNSEFVPTPEWLVTPRIQHDVQAESKHQGEAQPSAFTAPEMRNPRPAAVDGIVHRVETRNEPGVIVTHSLNQYSHPQCRLQARSINASRAGYQAVHDLVNANLVVVGGTSSIGGWSGPRSWI
jgi:hypothetical protein